MCTLRLVALAFFFALAAGCGSKTESGDNKSGGDAKPKAAGTKLTLDNLGRLQPGMSTLNDAKQTFGVNCEMTNDEKPGLGQGSRWVWKEDNRKVYVSIDINGKVSGVAWEGFDGR